MRLFSITTSRAAHIPVDNHVLPCLSGMHLSGWHAKLRAMSLIVEKKSSSVTAEYHSMAASSISLLVRVQRWMPRVQQNGVSSHQ